MKKLLQNLLQNLLIFLILIGYFFISSCARSEDRAGCSYLDGQGRYGTLTQYAKGKAKGSHIYIGDNLKDKVEITCNANSQQVLVK